MKHNLDSIILMDDFRVKSEEIQMAPFFNIYN